MNSVFQFRYVTASPDLFCPAKQINKHFLYRDGVRFFSCEDLTSKRHTSKKTPPMTLVIVAKNEALARAAYAEIRAARNDGRLGTSFTMGRLKEGSGSLDLDLLRQVDLPCGKYL